MDFRQIIGNTGMLEHINYLGCSGIRERHCLVSMSENALLTLKSFLGSSPWHLAEGIGERHRITAVSFLRRYSRRSGYRRVGNGEGGFESCRQYEHAFSSTFISRP